MGRRSLTKFTAGTPAPPIPTALMDWLMEVYPNRIPNPADDTDHQIWFDAGIQHVVQRLEAKHAKQGDT